MVTSSPEVTWTSCLFAFDPGDTVPAFDPFSSEHLLLSASVRCKQWYLYKPGFCSSGVVLWMGNGKT